MSDKLTRIEDKIDKIGDKLSSLDSTTVRQQAILEEHQRRSVANEEAVKIISKELKPVMLHVGVVNLIGKVVLLVIGSELGWEAIKWLTATK